MNVHDYTVHLTFLGEGGDLKEDDIWVNTLLILVHDIKLW
jgi:hypothetical protein